MNHESLFWNECAVRYMKCCFSGAQNWTCNIHDYKEHNEWYFYDYDKYAKDLGIPLTKDADTALNAFCNLSNDRCLEIS